MVTQGVDGGPGLSGLVVHTNTSLGLLFPSMFDAMSCRGGDKGHKERRMNEKGEGEGDRETGCRGRLVRSRVMR